MSSNLIVQALQACPSVHERLEFLESHLAKLASSYLHLDSGQLVPRDGALVDLGLTSLGATEFQHRLEKSLAIKLDSSTIFNFPTIIALRDYLAAEKLASLFVSDGVATRGICLDSIGAHTPADDFDADYVQALLSRRFGI